MVIAELGGKNILAFWYWALSRFLSVLVDVSHSRNDGGEKSEFARPNITQLSFAGKNTSFSSPLSITVT